MQIELNTRDVMELGALLLKLKNGEEIYSWDRESASRIFDTYEPQVQGPVDALMAERRAYLTKLAKG